MLAPYLRKMKNKQNQKQQKKIGTKLRIVPKTVFDGYVLSIFSLSHNCHWEKLRDASTIRA